MSAEYTIKFDNIPGRHKAGVGDLLGLSPDDARRVQELPVGSTFRDADGDTWERVR